MIDVSILIPTLYRPHRVTPLILNVAETANYTPYELVFMFPMDDLETKKTVIDNLLNAPIMYYQDEDDMRFVTRIQYMYENTEAEWIFTGADDIKFSDNWFDNAVEEAPAWANVISFDDMNNPGLEGTNFLISREHIQKNSCVFDEPNHIFHSEYKHNFCDNELILTSKMQDVFYKSSIKIQHFHHTTGGRPRDFVDAWAQSHWDDDGALWNERATKIIDHFSTTKKT